MYCIFTETACILLNVHHHIRRQRPSENRNEVLLLCVWSIFNKVIKVFYLDYAEEAHNVV